MNRRLAKLLSILSAHERRQFYWLLLVMVMMAVLEVAGIGSIMPFIAAVANMDAVLENRYTRYVYDFFGFDTARSFVLFLGGTVLILLIARNVFFALANWLVTRFTFTWRRNLSQQLLNKYLMQPYPYFLSKNTLELKRKVFHETDRLVSGVILPGLQVLSRATISLFIIALLVVIDPYIAVVVATILGGSYLLIYGLVYRKLGRSSEKASEARRVQFKIAGEAFEGIKELKLFGKERVYVDDYSGWAARTAKLETMSSVISQLPRHAIEMLAVAGIMGFLLYLIATGQNLSSWVPILVVYVVSGYRMLPALQQIFAGLTQIQYNLTTLDDLHADFTGLSVDATAPATPADRAQEFGHLETIELRDVDFRYSGAPANAIHHLDLRIEKNTTVGLVGPTGSGKTTLVDILLGLLQPLAGQLVINGTPVTRDNVSDWQQHIGYVPQHIVLFDDTVSRNVAFGVPDKDIDVAALEKAVRTANLHEYVMHSLPEGYNTKLGQRGIRLSGGQRQRIGIARALYRNPDILVLDEATSALDGITESVVMDAIQRLSHKLTIIMIAHRLNTVQNCDVIHYLDQGRVVSSGSYADLADSCEPFQKMLNP